MKSIQIGPFREDVQSVWMWTHTHTHEHTRCVNVSSAWCVFALLFCALQNMTSLLCCAAKDYHIPFELMNWFWAQHNKCHFNLWFHIINSILFIVQHHFMLWNCCNWNLFVSWPILSDKSANNSTQTQWIFSGISLSRWRRIWMGHDFAGIGWITIKRENNFNDSV